HPTPLLPSFPTRRSSDLDGGKSWRMFNLRGVVQFFVFDPLDANTLYAQSVGLWRSQDQGATWNLVYPKPSSITGLKMSSDHSDEDRKSTRLNSSHLGISY